MSVAPTVVMFSNINDDLTDAVIGHRAYSRAILSKLKLPIPASFIITSTGFYRFLHFDNGLNHWRSLLENVQTFSNEDMVTCARSLQNLVLHHPFDPDLADEITTTYHQILKKNWAHLTISPTATTPAPIHYPLPVIKGETSLLDFLRQLWAAQLSPHALSLHLSQTKNQIFAPAPILVSQFEKALVSGTIYSTDPQSGDKNLIRLETIWGTNPQNDPHPIPSDILILAKATGEVISRLSGKQTAQMVIDRFGHLKTIPLPTKLLLTEKLSSPQTQILTQAAIKIHNTMLKPQAINWLIVDKEIIFTRFSEIADAKPVYRPIPHRPDKRSPSIIASGLPASPGITTAPIIHPHLHATISGRIAIFKEANPSLIKRAGQAAGIIIESGGLTSELAMAAREIGIPTLVGTGPISQPDGSVITLDASNGNVLIPNQYPEPMIVPSPKNVPQKQVEDELHPTATKIYLSLHHIDAADTTNFSTVAGVGQCRGNQLIEEMGIHPKYLLTQKRDQLKELFTTSLENVCHGFGDRPVWYHPYDLDTVSAARLAHGSTYEPAGEQNPSIGFRGTYRLIHDDSIFAVELESIKYLRHKKGITNLHLTLPFVRSVDEYRAAKRLISSHGLYQSPSFQLYAEIGTPSSLELISQLAAEGVNGLHLNIDLLTMLLMGYDPNSAEVDQCLDYTDPFIATSIANIVKEAEKNRLPLLAHTYMFDQSSRIIDMALHAGVSAIVVSPNRYQGVTNWVAIAEAAALHPRQ